MNKSAFLFVPAAALTAAILSVQLDRAAGQEIALTPLEAKEVARGYRAEALKLKPVVNEKNETLGRIDDFVFSKEGTSVFVVLAVGAFTGLSDHIVAIPFHSLKLDASNTVVLPGTSRSALEKLPVYVKQ